MLLMSSCSWGLGGKEVEEPGDEEPVGVVKITIGDKVFQKSTEFATLHELLTNMVAVGDIADYKYEVYNEMNYPYIIDTLQDTATILVSNSCNVANSVLF